MIWLNLTCERCSKSFGATGKFRRFCGPCTAPGANDKGGIAARTVVASAVKRGDLPPAKQLICVDCGAKARDYDHRDYNKPLDVEPVCRGCNVRRGAAVPKKAEA